MSDLRVNKDLDQSDQLLAGSGFIYNPANSMMNEFYRMCSIFGWRGYRDGRDEAKKLFKHALAQSPISIQELLESEVGADTSYESPHSYAVDPQPPFSPVQRIIEVPAGSKKNPSKGHIEKFFDSYPTFDYKPTSSTTGEFKRMCNAAHWEERKMNELQALFNDALVKQFNDMYGTDENEFGAWQKLCRVLNADSPARNLKKCRKAVATLHFNLVDLVEVNDINRGVRVFASEKELKDYTTATGKIFPEGNPNAGGVLNYILQVRHTSKPTTSTDICKGDKRLRNNKPKPTTTNLPKADEKLRNNKPKTTTTNLPTSKPDEKLRNTKPTPTLRDLPKANKSRNNKGVIKQKPSGNYIFREKLALLWMKTYNPDFEI